MEQASGAFSGGGVSSIRHLDSGYLGGFVVKLHPTACTLTINESFSWEKK